MNDSIYPKPVDQMSDLEVLDWYIEECGAFIDPRIFSVVRRRGLLWVINTGLGSDKGENRLIVRARLSKIGHYTGDPEIEQIASKIESIETLKNKLLNTDKAEIKSISELAGNLKILCDETLHYFKTSEVL